MRVDYRFGEPRSAQVERLRDVIATEHALDAPFYSLRRDEALQRQSGKSGGGARVSAPAPAPGLVSNETKGTGPVEKVLVDGPAKRIKRMRNGVQHAARLMDFEAAGCGMPMVRKFLTLTYADVDGWEPDHINAFRRRLREWCARKGIPCRFVWVSELQQRGAVHYHVVVWIPAWHHLPTPDKPTRRGGSAWWPHGQTNICTARSPIGYISKYASKSTRDDAMRYPKGARMYGCGGLDVEQRRHLRYWQAPFWVRDALTGRADIRKVTGGYADRITGEFLPSPWAVQVTPDGRVYAFRKQETLQ